MGISQADKPPQRDADGFVKWIPIMVPLLAIVIVVAVYLIDWSLLSYRANL